MNDKGPIEVIISIVVAFIVIAILWQAFNKTYSQTVVGPSKITGNIATLPSSFISNAFVNLSYTSAITNYFGATSQVLSGNAIVQNSAFFAVKLNFYNSDPLNSHNINNIQVSSPFKVVNETPATSISVGPKTSVSEIVYVQAPTSSYSGNLIISVSAS